MSRNQPPSFSKSRVHSLHFAQIYRVAGVICERRLCVSRVFYNYPSLRGKPRRRSSVKPGLDLTLIAWYCYRTSLHGGTRRKNISVASGRTVRGGKGTDVRRCVCTAACGERTSDGAASDEFAADIVHRRANAFNPVTPKILCSEIERVRIRVCSLAREPLVTKVRISGKKASRPTASLARDIHLSIIIWQVIDRSHSLANLRLSIDTPPLFPRKIYSPLITREIFEENRWLHRYVSNKSHECKWNIFRRSINCGFIAQPIALSRSLVALARGTGRINGTRALRDE